MPWASPFFINTYIYLICLMESNVIEYNNITGIKGFSCKVIGETPNNRFEKYFRYSSDGILWSDYKLLTNSNLSSIDIHDNKIYIQYKFNKVGVKPLSIDSISLDVDYTADASKVIPDCFWNKSSNTPQIVYSSDGSNLFNPYAIGQSYGIYRQMSSIVSNMFGICVQYFKTEPNSKSRDVVLKEYSIEKVIDKKNIKILIPDNQLPTRELQFNSMMIDYPVQFEINIVKSEFQKIFGEDSHPDPHDYLYFSTFMNKMYMVDSVSDPDDFGYVASYWRVSLVPYQESASIKADEGSSLLDDTESLVFSAEGKFANEIQEEYDDNRKDNQLNDLGDLAEGQDWLRRVLDINLRIVDEKIYNDWTVISKQHYNLSTVDKGSKCVEYKYSGISSSDQRMISFAFRPNNMKNISGNIIISSVERGNNGVRLNLGSFDSLLVAGNMVKISRVSGLNGWHTITDSSRTGRWIEIDVKYCADIKLLSCGKMVAYEANECVYGGDALSVIQMPDKMVLSVNGNRYDYTFDNLPKFENRWYFCVLGMNGGLTNMWLYGISGGKEDAHSKIEYIGVCPNEIGQFESDGYFGLIGCNMCLTNFRLWSKLCEQELHNLILSQYVVDDTHNTLIVDNAQAELLKNYKWS